MLYIRTEDTAVRFIRQKNFTVIQAERAGLLPSYSVQSVLDLVWDDERRFSIRQEAWERYRTNSINELNGSPAAKNTVSHIKSLLAAGNDIVIAVPEYRGFYHSARRIIAEWLYGQNIHDIDSDADVPAGEIPGLPACIPGQETLMDTRRSDNINAGRSLFLEPGLLLIDQNGGLFVYLGYYAGRLPAVNNRIDEGYLYIRIWPWDTVKDLDTATDSQIIQCRQGLRAHIHPALLEYWACYTQSPKHFPKRRQVIDLSAIWTDIQKIDGLVRIAGTKPKRKR